MNQLLVALAIILSTGPSGTTNVVPGDCDSPTIVEAHNTGGTELHYLIRVDSIIVEEDVLGPGESVSREFTEPGFYRIRLGLSGDEFYSSDEATAEFECPTPPSPTTSTPPPTSPPPTSPPPTETSTTPPAPTTHTTTTTPPPTPVTGVDDVWLYGGIAAFLLLLGATILMRVRSEEG